MLRNYFTTALRNFLRNPVYSAINVFGLVLGLMCSIFIFLWVRDELSYDRYHQDNDNVFKVMWNNKYSDGTLVTDQWTNGHLAEGLKAEIPEIRYASRLASSEVRLFRYDETTNYQSGSYADQDIFQVLNLTILEGNMNTALPDINSVAISKKMAISFFKDVNALGKTFRVDNKWDATITAVFDDLPANATEKFEFIIPFQIYINSDSDDPAHYDGSGWQSTLVKLNDAQEKSRVEIKMAEFIKKNQEVSLAPPPPPFLFSMHDWRLYDSFVDAKQSGGRINYVISFSLVAALILVIACINFMNLSTARSMNRSREVGIRKVAGASRHVLIRQFLTESILLSMISMVVALLFVHALLPVFNEFTGKNLFIDYNDPVIVFVLISVPLVTGLIAGSYPAFFLSSFRPSLVLKGNVQFLLVGADLRKVLVVFQFGLSMIIIICAFVVSNQIDFIRNKNLGFDKENVISITTNEDLFKNYEVFRNDLLQSPLIRGVSLGDAHPMEINGEGYYDWDGKSDDDDTYFNQAVCDYDYLTTLGFTFVQGRNFSKEFPADYNNFIITEAAAGRMGFSNPIGQQFEGDGRKGEIIGVIKDFNNLSIQEPLHPTVFALGTAKEHFSRWVTVFVRYEPNQLTSSMDYIHRAYKKSSPDFPIQFRFVDQAFEKQFKSESMVGSLSAYFTIIAIAISCLGLFGLAAFSLERRTKEIGIRKVLGSSIKGLTVLLCKDFARLVAYSILIGSPVAYFIMQNFLSKYPYHTQLNFWMFAIPAFVMLLISLGVVSGQAIRAALRNPIDALRSE